jgi:transaldolase
VLGLQGVKLNVTALLTLAQALNPAVPAVVSVFAGRIADTGVDPMPIMRASGPLLTELPKAELLWGSGRAPKEILNLLQAGESGCAIITVPHAILAKTAKLIGPDLTAVSLDTVKMFVADSTSAGFKLR